ncbi:Histone H1.2 [Senna tora]|uniref:Histone H1.2 n=1 Tax=Senna tora TaxID=362788 RepID=A0A834SW61_9FABA|nr:Histone H1.2 [Senna tora]
MDAAAFFGVGLGGGTFFPGDVLVDVLEALAGLSFGLGREETFGLAATLGFAAAGLAFTGALAFAAAFGFATVFGLAGALVAALDVFVSLALEAGLALGFAAAGFFFAGTEFTDGFGADDLAGGSLKEPLTLTSFPAATSFLDWVKRSFLKLGGSCLCFSSINLAIAYWLEPVFSFSEFGFEAAMVITRVSYDVFKHEIQAAKLIHLFYSSSASSCYGNDPSRVLSKFCVGISAFSSNRRASIGLYAANTQAKSIKQYAL